VRYSRVRRSRLEVRRGGRGGEGAARDLGSGVFLARRFGATFPFWGIGADLAASGFFEDFAIPEV